ncbi:putative lipase atg15 [Lecanora helva]
MKTRKPKPAACCSPGSASRCILYLWLVASAIPIAAHASWVGSWLEGAIQVPLIFAPHSSPPNSQASSPAPQEYDFFLKHVFEHGLYENQDKHRRMDIGDDSGFWFDEDAEGRANFGKLHAKSATTKIERLSDRRVSTMQSMYRTARLTGAAAALDASAWTLDQVSAPNTTDKETVLTLARMSWDAYTGEPGTGEWQDATGKYNHSQGFGWEGDSLRGHIFADKGNNTVVIALKGTTPAVFDGAETTTNDKINDNLFFGCCCGQGGHYLWHQVCDCMTSAFTCNQTCLIKAIREENRYYSAAIELYGNVTEIYPNSNIWLVGHSLGGSTNALLGLTFGLPTTTFEAPGEALAAQRLGLTSPPGAHPNAPQTRRYTGAVHFGHTADPIFMGSCNAATSACTLGGYAMQTECHTGCVSRYDTVGDKKWGVSASYHRIGRVINEVIDVYDDVPPCIPDEECVDCFNWKYFNSNGSEGTTSSSSSSSTASPTRTTTCKTPGWWGCLDETTTTSSTSSSTPTSELPTTSCVKYGWFGGCVETTTFSPTTASPTATDARVPTITTTTRPISNSHAITSMPAS